MKKSEIDQHIRKYVLPNHPGYYVDQYVMYKTFGDNYYIRGYLFYSKGDNEMGLKVTYFVMPLFVREDRIAYTFGEELSYVVKQGLFKKTENIYWNTRKEHQAQSFEHISKVMEKQGEPILQKFNTAKDYYDLHKGERKDNIRVYESVAYSTILMRDEDLQDKMLKGLIKEANNERDVDWVHRLKAGAEQMLSIKNTEGRIKLLNSWANETIADLKLPHLKPFPV